MNEDTSLTGLAAVLDRATDRIDPPQLAATVLAEARRRRVRNGAIVAAGTTAAAAIIALATIQLPDREGDQGPLAPSTPQSPRSQNSAALTDEEIALAESLVRQELREEREEGTTLDSASVSVGQGKVLQSNTGHTCDSGRLLRIQLIGTFPHIVTSGGPPATEGSSPDDKAVHAVVLTADPVSGQVCLIGVKTGDVAPESDATVLSIG